MQSIEKDSAVAQDYLARIAKEAEAKFDEHLPPVTDRPCRLHEAMRYSMFAGGKRLRPHLNRLPPRRLRPHLNRLPLRHRRLPPNRHLHLPRHRHPLLQHLRHRLQKTSWTTGNKQFLQNKKTPLKKRSFFTLSKS